MCRRARNIRHQKTMDSSADLTEQLHVQSDGPHEQVDVAQSLAGHVCREALAIADGFHHAVPKEKS